MSDVVRGDLMRDGEVVDTDIVLNIRTGEVYPVTPGTAILFDGDVRDLRFGPGIAVPVAAVGSYAQQVLDVVGNEVERDLTWEWPRWGK